MSELTFGRYRVNRIIGEGGMGRVYLAVDTRLQRPVVLKVLLQGISDETAIARFYSEARVTSRIKHPGIVEIYDFDVENGIPYIAMEPLGGETIAERLRSGRLDVLTATRFALQTAHSLEELADRNIVHRDIKPANLFLVRDPDIPGGERVKLIDFGIVKLTGSELTVYGTVIGTPPYMSPEQCNSSRDIDHRSDLYSLGCVLFEMISGRTPFVREGLTGMLVAHVIDPIPKLEVPGVPAGVDAIISKLLAKHPRDRYQTAKELAAALVPFTASTSPPASTPPPPRSATIMGMPVIRTLPADAASTVRDAGPIDAAPSVVVSASGASEEPDDRFATTEELEQLEELRRLFRTI